MNRTTKFTCAPPGTTITDPGGNVTVLVYQNNELLSLTRDIGTGLAVTCIYTDDPVSLGITSAQPAHITGLPRSGGRRSCSTEA